MSKFSERLKQLRLEHNLTQVQLAKALQMGQATISAYESNTNRPNDEVICSLCQFFHVSADYLLGLEDWNGYE